MRAVAKDDTRGIMLHAPSGCRCLTHCPPPPRVRRDAPQLLNLLGKSVRAAGSTGRRARGTSEVRGTEVRSQKSEVRSQKSESRNLSGRRAEEQGRRGGGQLSMFGEEAK
jgi:hypothetical protein